MSSLYLQVQQYSAVFELYSIQGAKNLFVLYRSSETSQPYT